MRKRIKKAAYAIYGITPLMIDYAKRKADERGFHNKRPTWWYDCGLLTATVGNGPCYSCTVYSKGMYMGQN
jgi:hypothetical protein